ncbi:hypothetical protein CFPU101_44530 [Chroococcus sp. FPU101]|nr:hypothetical protein CFPU101_44530 [Chroococcus sp. FPU101]
MMCWLSEAGYQVIAPDLPGYGKSNGFTIEDYALENQTARLHELMKDLGIKSFDVAGSSMGGAYWRSQIPQGSPIYMLNVFLFRCVALLLSVPH